jgi:hypothetical protein
MVMCGETLSSGALWVCRSCGVDVRLSVLMSAAGYFVGGECGCGVYSRESGYFRSRSAAAEALCSGRYGR